MAEQARSIFISYSRSDSDFVDRLEADLRARDFQVWVDRQRVEGGQDWAEMIQRAIERSEYLLVVLSPDAVASEWVKKEIGFAQSSGKYVIPLLYRRVAQVPIRLEGLQWIEFVGAYQQGLDALLYALATPVPPPPPNQTAAPPPFYTPPQNAGRLDNVTAQPGPPPPDPDLNALYKAALQAKGAGNLELAAVYLQQIVSRDQSFGQGIAAGELQTVLARLRPIRVQRLRAQAQDARLRGAWGEEIGAWQALLAVDRPYVEEAGWGSQGLSGYLAGSVYGASGADPMLVEAKERLDVARQNQQWEWLYTNARDLHAAGQAPAARETIQTLWRQAPFFGDPDGIARALGLPLPPTFEQAKATEQAQRKRKETADFAQDKLRTSRFVLWLWAVALIAGLGALCVVLIHIWPLALGASIVLAIGGYVLAFRRALSPMIFAFAAAFAGSLVLVVSFLVNRVDYAEQIQLFYYSNGNQTAPWTRLSLGTLVLFGAVYGVAVIVVHLITAFVVHWLGKSERDVLLPLMVSQGIPVAAVLVLTGLPSLKGTHDAAFIIGLIVVIVFDGAFGGAVVGITLMCMQGVVLLAFWAFDRDDRLDFLRDYFTIVLTLAVLHVIMLLSFGSALFGLPLLAAVSAGAAMIGVSGLGVAIWVAIE